MPNIQTKNLTYESFPLSYNEYTFHSVAKNSRKKEHLILVSYKDKQFFLTVIQRENDFLIKLDKLTRLSPISIIQDALKTFKEIHNLELTFSNIDPEQKKSHLERSDEFLKSINYFALEFESKKEIWVEVGFGSGRHLLHQAKQNPTIQFIGLEIHRPSIEQLIKQCKIQNLENVLIAGFDARIFLELLKSNSVGKIFVHFPVPWDKKPHRRVISETFINESIRVLKKGGSLELRTDSENYFAYSFETFISLNKCDLKIKKNQEIAITSKYEDRWRRQEKNIYDITLINDEISEEKTPYNDLLFDKIIPFKDIKSKFHNHTIRGESYFIHYEDLYEIDDKNGYIKLSFGSNEKPEHKYIIFKENKIEYFPNITVPIRQNYEAHLKIKEFIYG